MKVNIVKNLPKGDPNRKNFGYTKLNPSTAIARQHFVWLGPVMVRVAIKN